MHHIQSQSRLLAPAPAQQRWLQQASQLTCCTAAHKAADIPQQSRSSWALEGARLSDRVVQGLVKPSLPVGKEASAGGRPPGGRAQHKLLHTPQQGRQGRLPLQHAVDHLRRPPLPGLCRPALTLTRSCPVRPCLQALAGRLDAAPLASTQASMPGLPGVTCTAEPRSAASVPLVCADSSSRSPATGCAGRSTQRCQSWQLMAGLLKGACLAGKQLQVVCQLLQGWAPCQAPWQRLGPCCPGRCPAGCWHRAGLGRSWPWQCPAPRACLAWLLQRGASACAEAARRDRATLQAALIWGGQAYAPKARAAAAQHGPDAAIGSPAG